MLAHARARCSPIFDRGRVRRALADDERYATYDWKAFGDRIAPLWCGGPTRRDSVLNGLVPWRTCGSDDWVLVHDAARPCLARGRRSPDLGGREDENGGILRCAGRHAEARGRPATHCRDEPRERLWLAQTPQMFRHGTLLRALGGARGDRRGAPSSARLKPRLVPAAYGI